VTDRQQGGEGTSVLDHLRSGAWRTRPPRWFAAVTDDPPAEVSAGAHDRMIVNRKPEHAALRPLQELQGILSDR
jgi:hypothetical protein